jgi:polysaccharide biosynthesis/export protein
MSQVSMIRKLLSAAAISFLFLGGTAVLEGQGLVAIPAAETAVAAPSATAITQPKLEQRYPRYVIQREDVLQLSFPLTPELNQTVTVQPDGYINLQNAGSLHVQGITVPQLTVALKKAYAGTLHNPIIDVDLKDFQKPFFTVSGQVGKPGKYDLREDITIAEGIAIAGGLQPTAKTQVFLFHKTTDGRFQVEKFNLKQILQGKNLKEDAQIKPGDMVYVPEKFIANFRKYVPYSVNAGTYLQPTP